MSVERSGADDLEGLLRLFAPAGSAFFPAPSAWRGGTWLRSSLPGRRGHAGGAGSLAGWGRGRGASSCRGGSNWGVEGNVR